MRKPRRPRRPPRTQTPRVEAITACAAHLSDLRRARKRPPPDVALSRQPLPKRIAAEPTSSYCVSPAALCAELVE